MLLNFSQVLFGGRWRPISICLLQLHGQECESLANVIVQIARDAAALLLLGLDQPATHVFESILSNLVARNIDSPKDEAANPPVAIHSWRCNIEHPAVD